MLRRRKPTRSAAAGLRPGCRPAALSSSPIQQRYRTPSPPGRIDAPARRPHPTKIPGTRPNRSDVAAEGVAGVGVAGPVAGREPALPLLGGAVRPGLRADPALGALLDPVVADRRRGVERDLDVLLGRRLDQRRPRRWSRSWSRRRRSSPPAARAGPTALVRPGRLVAADPVGGAEQVLHVVAVLVGDDVGLRERAALRAEAAAAARRRSRRPCRPARRPGSRTGRPRTSRCRSRSARCPGRGSSGWAGSRRCGCRRPSSSSPGRCWCSRRSGSRSARSRPRRSGTRWRSRPRRPHRSGPAAAGSAARRRSGRRRRAR